MQRYSQGREVPELAMDTFTGKTTNGAGEIDCVLTYTPKDINHISVSYGENPLSLGRFCTVRALVGKTVTLLVFWLGYSKADTSTATDVGSVGGAANHSHVITFANASIWGSGRPTEAQPPITVIYEPT